MSVNFNLKFQSEHFGNIISLSIEGYNIEIVDKELNNTCKFRTHFSNDSSQNAYTTHAYPHNSYVRGTQKE